MIHKSKKGLILIYIFFIIMVYGIFALQYELFPSKVIEKWYSDIFHRHYPNENSIWSIGIYGGKNIFELEALKDINNPIITYQDVNDVNAEFVADPFMLIKDEKLYIFFEVMNVNTKQGDIGYAESIDGKQWNYQKIIIDENFSLSYPYVFEWNNDYYIIPESHKDLSVRLYKATKFPDSWEYVGNILTGQHFTDPTILRYKNKWWLFVTTFPNSNELNLYYSTDLIGGWESHQMNPIVNFDKNCARSGGRIIIDNNTIYRVAQDDYPIYGQSVNAIEIVELSEYSYSEKLISSKPIIDKTGNGWNRTGMHHIDLQKYDNKWIAVVDGRN